MNGGEPSVWSVVSVSAPDLARTERGPAAVQHAEWVRLFLGRALAPARLVGQEHAPSAVEYLISGIEVSGSLHRDDAACIEAASAVATDFEGLRDVIAYHRDRIERCAQDPNNVPLELFLTTYPMLMCVTVSDDPADWRVTDQGLCIVRWGLRGPRHRPLLQWSAQELQALQRRVIAAAGMPDVAPGEASYSRVAKSAWKVIKDDDEQQRVQKVGDRPKITGGESKAASGKPEEANPSPVAARAAWMAWLETGLIVLPLTVVVLMLLINNQRHSEAIKKVKNDAVAAQATAVEEAVNKAKAEAASALDAAVANAVTRAKGDAATARTTTVEEAVDRANEAAAAAQATAVEEAVNKAKAEAASALATAVEKAVEKAKANVANDAGMDQEKRKPDSVSSQGPAKAEQSAKKPADLDIPLDDVQSSGDENNLQSALRQLARSYNNPAATEVEVSELATRVSAHSELGKWATESYLRTVHDLRSVEKSKPFLDALPRMSVEIPVEIFEVLKQQNDSLAKQNALVFVSFQSPANFDSQNQPKQRWYWLAVTGAAQEAFTPLDECIKQLRTKREGKFKVATVKSPGFTLYESGNLGSVGKEWYMWADVASPFEVRKPVPVPFVVPTDKSHKIQDLVDSLSGFAASVMLNNPADAGQKESKSVRIPAFVAREFAQESLRKLMESRPLLNSETNSANDAVRAWCESLLKVLEATATDGKQQTIPDRMAKFKERLEHPPFFPSAKSTCVLWGALSVSGIHKEIVGIDGAINDRAGQLAAFDGTVLKHIGYLKDGKPFITMEPNELGPLLGCAVFVIEPANPKQRTRN